MLNHWKFQCCVVDNQVYRVAQTLYLACVLKAELLWFNWWQCLSSSYYVELTTSPDCIKTFDTFESQITVFGNIFETNIILMNNVYLESFILCKNVTFLNEGTFAWTLPVQEVGILLKWNNSKGLGKGFSYVKTWLWILFS